MALTAPFTGTDRFEILRSLGRGSFGQVFEAKDRERDLKVALKVPYDAVGQNLLLFKQEFRALAEVSHPNLVTLFELMVEEGTWFFTMELLDGQDALSYLRQDNPHPGSLSHLYLAHASSQPDPPTPKFASSGIVFHEEETLVGRFCSLEVAPPPDFDRVRRVFLQVAEGLLALHRAGLLHRDLKPSNVLVTREGRAVILDFGLALDLGSLTEAPGPASRITGTPAYMAPEQIDGAFSAEASDWYSFGVMLYQTLTGRLPFTGPLTQMLTLKRETDPPSPAQLLPSIPADLDRLCRELLSRDPGARPKGLEVLARLNPETPTTPRLAPRPEHDLGLPPARQRELDILLRAFDGAAQGHTAAVLVHSLPGMGKSSLLRLFTKEARARSPHALLLRARCQPHESVPFKAVDGVVDDLSDFLRRLPPHELKSLLPEDTPALARLFPVLNQVREIAQWPKSLPDLPDVREYRRRAFGAFREILDAIALRRPVALLIEDIQWSDRDSEALLLELLQPPAPPPLFLLLASHSEDHLSQPIVRGLLPKGQPPLCPLEEVELGPLSEEESRHLALGALRVEQPDAEDLAAWAARESGGHPFFLAELVHALRTQPVRPTQPVEGLEAHLRRRLDHLDVEALRLMELLAIAGRPLDWTLLTQAAGLETKSATHLTLLRNSHLLRVRGSTSESKLVEPFHVRITQTLLSQVSEEEARAGHLALARTYERHRPEDIRSLAWHYTQADIPSKAAHFTELAAVSALQAFAFDQAAELFQTSIAFRDAEDPDIPRLYHHLADALASAGRGPEAARAYLRVLELQEGAYRTRLLRRASEEYFRSGHVEEALQTLAPSLSEIGEPYPATQGGALLSLLFHRLRLRLTRQRLDIPMRPMDQIPAKELERADILWAMAMGLGPVDVTRGADYQARQLLHTLRLREPFRLVRGLAHETIFQAFGGNKNLKRTQATLERTVALAEQLDHPNPRGRALIAQGLAALLQGHWKAAISPLERAEMLLRDHCRGLDYEIQIAQEHSLLAHAVSGDLATVTKRLPLLLQTARDRGSHLTQAYLRVALGHFTSLALDDPAGLLSDLREALVDWPQGVFHTLHYHELVARAHAELYAGRPLGAAAYLRGRWGPLRRSMLLSAQVLRITCLELRGRLSVAEACHTVGWKRSTLLRRARRDAARIRREHTPYGEALALKLMACIDHVAGREEAAQQHLGQAVDAFKSCDMALHVAACQYTLGQWTGQADLCHRAAQQMGAEGILRPDRWAAMHFPVDLKR